ncbi:hypothetical protein ACLSZA_08860, partial [Avibacterium volantium]
SMPNLEVKRCNADGSVGISHVRVGHRQVLNEGRTPLRKLDGVFYWFYFISPILGFILGRLFCLI